MPLSTAALKGLIVSEISAAFPEHVDQEALDKVAGAIAAAVVTHLKSAAVVVVPGQPPGTVA